MGRKRYFFQYEERAGRIYVDRFEFGEGLQLQIDGHKQMMRSPVRLFPSFGNGDGRLHTTLTTWQNSGVYIFDLALLIGVEVTEGSAKVTEHILHRIKGTEIREVYQLKTSRRAYVIEFGKYGLSS